MENFEVDRIDRSEISILRLKGFLDAHTAPNFEQAIQELLEENRYKIIISMSDLNYISSAGLGVFMGFIEEIRKSKKFLIPITTGGLNKTPPRKKNVCIINYL